MAVGTYLGQALSGLQLNADKQANAIVAGGGGRFTYDNADQIGGADGHALATDRTRIQQLNLLRDKLNDPNLQKGVNDLADSRLNADTASIGSNYQQANGRLRASLARRGIAGGGMDAQQSASLDVQRAAAQAKAKSQADEIRAAGITGLQDLEKQLTDQIMQLDDDGAGKSRLDLLSGEAQGQRMQSQLDDQYRGLLANSLAGVVNNAITPAITSGFDYADRQNAANDRTDTLAMYNGETPQSRQRSSWWNF